MRAADPGPLRVAEAILNREPVVLATSPRRAASPTGGGLADLYNLRAMQTTEMSRPGARPPSVADRQRAFDSAIPDVPPNYPAPRAGWPSVPARDRSVSPAPARDDRHGHLGGHDASDPASTIARASLAGLRLCSLCASVTPNDTPAPESCTVCHRPTSYYFFYAGSGAVGGGTHNAGDRMRAVESSHDAELAGLRTQLRLLEERAAHLTDHAGAGGASGLRAAASTGRLAPPRAMTPASDGMGGALDGVSGAVVLSDWRSGAAIPAAEGGEGAGGDWRALRAREVRLAAWARELDAREAALTQTASTRRTRRGDASGTGGAGGSRRAGSSALVATAPAGGAGLSSTGGRGSLAAPTMRTASGRPVHEVLGGARRPDAAAIVEDARRAAAVFRALHTSRVRDGGINQLLPMDLNTVQAACTREEQVAAELRFIEQLRSTCPVLLSLDSAASKRAGTTPEDLRNALVQWWRRWSVRCDDRESELSTERAVYLTPAISALRGQSTALPDIF